MSDEVANKFDQELKEARTDGRITEGRSVTMTITMHPNGQL